MTCPIHSPGYRHPSCCRHCRVDHEQFPDNSRLAPSERGRHGQGSLGLEPVSGEPPSRAAKGMRKWFKETMKERP